MNRKDAVKILHRILYFGPKETEKKCHHIGNVELREFFDEVWGPPSDENEEISLRDMEIRAPND